MKALRLDAALRDLDEPQFAAATYNGPKNAAVLAGPGAGKTSTIVARYGYKTERLGSAAGVLCVTFSVAAAEEMRKRIGQITGDDALVSTFHAQALRIINAERKRLPFKLSMTDPILQGPKVKRILRGVVPKGEDIGSIAKFIGLCRRNLIDPETALAETAEDFEMSAREQRFAVYYDAYDKAMREVGGVDFDSMVYYAVRQLQRDANSEAIWCGRYEEVMVDEAHDTSADQAEFARLMASTGRLVSFGDPSQSIYGFRGASNDLLLGPDQEVFYLGNNYRSLGKIVAAFKPFAEKDELSQKLVAAIRSVREGEGKTVLRTFRSEDEEVFTITAEITDAVQTFGNATDFAILSRTRSYLAAYSDHLSELGIPYRWIGKNFWKSGEVKDALAFARFWLDPTDLDSFVRIICSGARAMKYLGRAFAEQACRTARRASLDAPRPLEVDSPEAGTPQRTLQAWRNAQAVLGHLFANKDLSPTDFFFAVKREAGFGTEDDDYDDGNHDEFAAENFTQLAIRSARFPRMVDFLRHADLMARQASNPKGVTLSTIHGAKGLEWETVYVAAFDEGHIPHRKATDWNEERRIAYVALSRSRDALNVSCHGVPSPFFELIPKEEVTNAEEPAVSSPPAER